MNANSSEHDPYVQLHLSRSEAETLLQQMRSRSSSNYGMLKELEHALEMRLECHQGSLLEPTAAEQRLKKLASLHDNQAAQEQMIGQLQQELGSVRVRVQSLETASQATPPAPEQPRARLSLPLNEDVQEHAEELAAAINAKDWTGARYHENQLLRLVQVWTTSNSSKATGGTSTT